MPKVKLTQELSNALKNTRNDKGIKAADVAKHIKKSLAFISKLENKMAEHVELDVLIEIFKFLFGEDENLDEFINPLLEKATIELTPEEIKKREWIMVFDLEYRRIPIPALLVEFINSKLAKLNLTPEQVILEMNKNDELSDKDKYNKNKNSLILRSNKESSNSIIVFELKDNLLTEILNGERKTSNYITMEGIVRTIYKIEGFTVDDAINEAISTLNTNKFYSLYEKKKLFAKNNRNENIDALLTEYDKENFKTVNSIIKHISVLSDWDIDYANKNLKNLDDSFNIDPPFIMAIIGSKFSKLKNVKKGNKKQFISEINKLIDKFSNITPDPEKDFETY